MFDKPRPGVPGGSSAPPQTKDAEDIFAKVGDLPISPSPATTPPLLREDSTSLPPSSDRMMMEMGEDPSKKWQWLRLALLILFGIIILGGIGYGVLAYIANRSVLEESPLPSSVSLDTPKPVEPIPTAPPTDEIAKPKEENPAEKDSDSDGISDQEEAILKTNPKDFDSDDDGLFDFDEVRVYETDPLKADTDNDGFKDGEEVRNGYNPKGAGKLFEIP